jgi:hypothetical protein
MKLSTILFTIFLLLNLPKTALSSTDGESFPYPESPIKYSQTRTDYDRESVTGLTPYKGPIIDTHAHYDAGQINQAEFDKFDTLFKSNNIKYAFFMPVPNEGQYLKGKKKGNDFGEFERSLLLKANNRIKTLCSSNYISNWLHDAYNDGWYYTLDSRLERLQRDIDSGNCIGIGEVSNYHFNKKPSNKRPQHIISYPLNFKPLHKFIDVIVKNNTWLVLHIEPVTRGGESYEEQYFSGLELLFQKHPNLKLILAHTGMTNSVNAEKILRQYPNVMMSLKLIKKPSKRWINIESINNNDFEVFNDWAMLVGKFPERFLIDSDAKFGRKGRKNFGRYEELIYNFRSFLGSLSPESARLVAYKNAERLWNLK